MGQSQRVQIIYGGVKARDAPLPDLALPPGDDLIHLSPLIQFYKTENA
ncbi:hypothetical protein MICA_2445 [Micavibrio aeruginosavorus ARL-13]|uniref:Uncharacterized protein n=1 Tax=Micavibrio aeruginosavorus (strain ARL-13) TaxID=856793 RepID=G2KNV2_MICAA|nr:hypothetical protein MICA_2445 [Micavibrio aeruginosavorus ARL-13]